MDWFSWLSRTTLDPSLVYEYGLAFSHNELEEEDITYFSHEFLQSMGVSIAKHRLEILKLARKQHKELMSSSPPHPMSKLVVAIKRTKKCLAKHIQAWIHRDDDSSLALVSRPSYGTRWKNAMMKRNKNLVSGQGNLLLTNGNPRTPLVASARRVDSFSSPFLVSTPRLHSFSGPVLMSTPRINSFSSPLVCAHAKEEKMDAEDDYWLGGVEEIRWDSMFQNLKPT